MIPTKKMSVLDRAREALIWEQLRTVLVVNTAISFFMFGIIYFLGDRSSILRTLIFAFVYSWSIGTTGYFLTVSSGVLEAQRVWVRTLSFLGLMILTGCGGTLIAFIPLALFFRYEITRESFWQSIVFDTFLSVCFGFTLHVYFLLKDKLASMANRLAEKEITEQRLLRLKTKAELDALRAQVNPHFLFNTLNSIASLIPLDPPKAEEMVQKLARLFRYVLDAGNGNLVKLAEEMNVIRDYLDIEKVRLGGRLTYEIGLNEDAAELLIPALLLQPLVENSVKHGIAPRREGGVVRVNCIKQGEHCQIEVIDTGKGFSPTAGAGLGFGLRGIRERLQLHFGSDFTFEISGGQETRICMRIPIHGQGT